MARHYSANPNVLPKSSAKELFHTVLCVLLVAAIYSVIGCPIRLFTGISCPGCGMTRAWMCVLSLDFDKAFYYHPLWPLPAVFVLAWLWVRKRNGKVYRLMIYAGAALLLIAYALRLYMRHPVIQINPFGGLLVQGLRTLFVWTQ